MPVELPVDVWIDNIGAKYLHDREQDQCKQNQAYGYEVVVRYGPTTAGRAHQGEVRQDQG